MAVTLDVFAAYLNGRWDSQLSKELADGLARYELLGEVGEWLAHRKHDGTFIRIEGEHRYAYGVGYIMRFNDPRLATLFKLTWL